MTSRSPYRLALLALSCVLLAAGCGSKPSNSTTATGSDSGTGTLGEAGAGGQAGAAPTPIPTPPVEEEPMPPTSPPTTGPGGTVGPVVPSVVLTIPPGVLVPWPSSPDCITHDPASAKIVYTASSTLWQIVTSTSTPLAFKREVDAKDGLALVQAYKKHCFIGRNNTRTDKQRYIMDYWLDPVVSSPAIASPDCLSHTASELVVKDVGTLGWRLESTGGEAIALFDTKADADNALLVFKHYNRHCYIGRGYSGTDRLNYIANWFATV